MLKIEKLKQSKLLSTEEEDFNILMFLLKVIISLINHLYGF